MDIRAADSGHRHPRPSKTRQIDALTAAGCRRIFADKRKAALRPELTACRDFLTASDTLIVPSPDRYGRSLQDLITMVSELCQREIRLRLLGVTHPGLLALPLELAGCRAVPPLWRPTFQLAQTPPGNSPTQPLPTTHRQRTRWIDHDTALED
ncbi:recombinase family protein [Streptomyces sp. NPDC046942]|uniref:recombinase family protein n=1 Tax=Streptomyces sp. NPDC046942 TaxID=3155137 RepID=UPI0033F172B8